MRGRPALADAALSPDMMEVGDVRFGSEADARTAKGRVRFTPNSDRKSSMPQW
jgi:hypothetical protein